MVKLLTVMADGLAYGTLLFLLASGLSITLGLMRYINLAHGAFGMCGGYVAARLMNSLGVPFLLTLPAAFLLAGVIGFGLERIVIRFLYRKPALQQVLFSIGLAFAASAIATIVFGPQQQPVRLPSWLTARLNVHGIEIDSYGIFLVGIGVIAATTIITIFNYTLFGARVRAAVDNRRAAEGVGIRVDRLFAITFALGAGMAGLGGALAINVLGLDPAFPFKYLVIVLVVVTVGGPGSIGGSAVAAMALGVIDALFKYFVPEVGPFVIYALLIVILIAFPKGLARRSA
jgi:branched-chain amino acid transport system permease protein